LKLLVRLSVVLSLLTGCKPKPEPVPDHPGTSLPLVYPVVLVEHKRIQVSDDELRFTTTTAATGPAFFGARVIDSAGGIFEIRNVTPFGRKAFILDAVGTNHYRVHLAMKALPGADLRRAKQIVLEGADEPDKAKPIIEAQTNITELIEACRTSWKWR
jgi:hypothetical protein